MWNGWIPTLLKLDTDVNGGRDGGAVMRRPVMRGWRGVKPGVVTVLAASAEDD
jgi:hypothetical protein